MRAYLFLILFILPLAALPKDSGNKSTSKPTTTQQNAKDLYKAKEASIGTEDGTSKTGAGLPPNVPELSDRVTDLADVLSGATRNTLRERFEKLEEETGAQIAFLSVPSLNGENLEAYSIKVAETWGLGREDVDDGLLIFIAKQEKRIRIEVGYGLEGVVTDINAKMVIDDYMTPHFKDGDFDAGILAAADALIALVKEEELPPPPENDHNIWEIIFAVLIILGMIAYGIAFAKIKKWQYRLALFLIPCLLIWLFFGWEEMVPMAGVFGFISMFSFAGSRGGGSGSSSYSSSSYSSSSYSSAGSSFSGGGGSFGGGGASGGW